MNTIEKNTQKEQEIFRKKSTRKHQEKSSIRLEMDGTIGINNVPLLEEAYANGTRNVHVFFNYLSGCVGIQSIQTEDPFVYDLMKEGNRLKIGGTADIRDYLEDFLGFKEPRTCPVTSVDYVLDDGGKRITKMAYFHLEV